MCVCVCVCVCVLCSVHPAPQQPPHNHDHHHRPCHPAHPLRDPGGAKRADVLAKKLGADFALFSKQRKQAGKISKMTLVGEVRDKTAIIIDDMADTAGTLCKAAKELKKAGAKEIIAAVVHGVLSDPAIERINKSVISELIVTDTIPLQDKYERCEKMTVLSVARLLSDAMWRIHVGGSLSKLFDYNSSAHISRRRRRPEEGAGDADAKREMKSVLQKKRDIEAARLDIPS